MLELTAIQIQNFILSASCCFSNLAAQYVDKLAIGDVDCSCEKKDLILVNAMLEAIQGYDPALTTNCLTYDQIFSMMQWVSKKLGICADLNQLSPYVNGVNPNVGP